MPTCKNCEAYFPTKIKINGELKNLSNRTVCLDCLPFKSKRRSSYCSDITHKICPKCNQDLPFTEFFPDKTKGLSSYCKSCVCEYTVEKNRLFKEECVTYKGGCCQLCGYKTYIGALEFHHLDPSQKDFSISNRSRHKLTKEVMAELDKCILLCSNCHKEVHGNVIKLTQQLETI